MPMPLSLAPGYARLTYDGALFPHHMTIPVNYDGTPTPGAEPTLILKDATTAIATDALDPLFALFQPFFAPETHFGLCELHTVDDMTGEDQFIFSFNVGRLGIAIVDNIPTSQMIFVYKTGLGSLYKLYFMEGVTVPNQKFLPPYTDDPQSDLTTFVTGDASPIYGRKNSYPFTAVSALSKYNDKLRKQQGLA